MPIDYIESLKAKGNRKKARAFMEYFYDMDSEEDNSYGFYAKSWEVSKSTAYAWVDEFNRECELFISHWELKNKRHYSYAKNTAERQPNDSRTKKEALKPNNTDFKETNKTATERQPNKALNIDIVVESDFATDGEFNAYYSELRFIAGKYVGGKEQTYRSYMKVKDFLNMKVLVKAYKEYVKSVNTYNKEKIQGFSKFIENDMYLAFLPKKIKVISEQGVFEGHYENETLKTTDGRCLGITHSKYIEFLKNQKIDFLEVA